jgi:pimeloyl-ACP methyl ester carboxylesterase
MKPTTSLEHGRISIQLYRLHGGQADETPLLLLHQLGANASEWGDEWESWPGSVYGLDFAGHGQSDRVTGRSYYPELFLVDADLALESIGERACVAGAGMGAYVAMLLAGARPDRVPAALLLPGRGLESGGSEPDFDRPNAGIEAWEARLETAARLYSAGTDPFVATCEKDLRPLDYVSSFASAARHLLFSEAVDVQSAEGDALQWWQTALQTSGNRTVSADPAAALRELATHAS